MKSIAGILLLMSMAFSVVHDIAESIMEHNHHAVVLDSSLDLHEDIEDQECDMHNAYHTIFFLPSKLLKVDVGSKIKVSYPLDLHHYANHTLKLYRPPIV